LYPTKSILVLNFAEQVMMGRQDDRQQTLFYDFCLEDHVPQDHLLRRVAAVLDLRGVRQRLAPYYSNMGRPSLDPELMIRMLLVGYIYGIRSERRLVEEVHRLVQLIEIFAHRPRDLGRIVPVAFFSRRAIRESPVFSSSLLLGERSPAQTRINSSMVGSDKSSAKPRRYSPRLLCIRVIVDALHVTDDDLGREFVAVLFPDVCFKQRLPFVTKFEDFRRTQSPPLAENKTDHVLKERIQAGRRSAGSTWDGRRN
jgi:hypothetical protein